MSAAGDRYDYFGDGLTEEMITELACSEPRTARRDRPNLGDSIQIDLGERRADWQRARCLSLVNKRFRSITRDKVGLKPLSSTDMVAGCGH